MKGFGNHKGFTLIELILVIVLLGIVSVSTANFMRGASDIYIDVTEREALMSNASFAVERFTRELSSAVPNSVRVAGNTSAHCIEFVPVNWNTFYFELPTVGDSSPRLSLLELADIDNQLYVPDGDDFAIVYPLAVEHVYDISFNRRQTILSCSDDGDGDCATQDDSDRIVELTLSDGFASDSPNKRVYIADSAIAYCLRNENLYRHRVTIQASQSIYTSGGELMARGIKNTLSSNPQSSPSLQDPFRAIDASLSRNGFVRTNFLFARDDEQVSIVKEVQVPNVP